MLVAAVVLFEIPNRGKTLLQPFKAAVVKPKQGEVPSVEQQAAIGQVVFDHLVNTLGALTQDLQPDVILLLPPDPLRGAQFRTIAAGGSGSLDPFLSGPSDLDLGVGVKIPLGFVLTPIVKPVRWLLGVRIIEGSVLADPQGYTVLVRSSSGEVWQARLRGTEQSQERLAPASAFKDLALELAFRIMSAEPALASVGMTRSWEAFDRFREGLEFWQRYAVQSGEQDPDALTQAIRGFRAAVGVDPAFALAHYRLGLALQKDGQPIAAAEALQHEPEGEPRIRARARRARVRALRAREPIPGDVDSAPPSDGGVGCSRRAMPRAAGAQSDDDQAGATPPTDPKRTGEPYNAMLDEARVPLAVRGPGRRAGIAARPGGGVGGAVPACVRARRRRGSDARDRCPPAGSGRPVPGHDCSTRPISIASRPTASTPRSSIRDGTTSGSGPRARRSWPRSACCSSSTGRRGLVTTWTGGSARRTPSCPRRSCPALG